jgi:hypothetical protein
VKPATLVYVESIEHLRRRARELGYALAVHGSLARDIDLLACPWTDEAVSADELAEAIRKQAELSSGCKVYQRHDNPGHKPHGRLAYTLIYAHGQTYIDLSVMPRK